MRTPLTLTTAGFCAALLVSCSSDPLDDGPSPGDAPDDNTEVTCARFVTMLADCGVITGTRLAGCEDDNALLPCLMDCVENASCGEIEAAYCYLQSNTFTECVEACVEAVPATFVCDNGAPIQARWRCDGAPDCPNGEDEDCPSGMFTCNGGLMIPAGWQCDGVEDCGTGEDELDCGGGSAVSCGDGTTVLSSRQCDGVPDCVNGVDELDCTRLTCG